MKSGKSNKVVKKKRLRDEIKCIIINPAMIYAVPYSRKLFRLLDYFEKIGYLTPTSISYNKNIEELWEKIKQNDKT